MSTDLERRLQAALAARAEQVGPTDLADRPLPAPPRRTRPATAWLAAAACLAVVGGGVAVAELGADRAPVPAPAPDEPEVVLPPDVGRAWPRAEVDTYGADLDGDGIQDDVRFRAEPDPDFAGRFRLESRLSGGGEAYGVVDLGSTLSVDTWAPADLDQDLGEEVVLSRGLADGIGAEAIVLDLRDGVLVEAPPVEDGAAVLRRGPVTVPDAGTVDYRLARDHDYWTGDGGLRSSASVRAFPSFGMDYYLPRTFVADAWSWTIGEDGLLRPEAIEPVCVTDTTTRRACEPGETDALPDRTPVVTDPVGAGEDFEIEGIVRATVEVSAQDGATVLLVEGPDVSFSTGQLLEAGTRVFPEPAVGLFSDGVSLLLDRDADGQPDGLLLGVPDRQGQVELVVEDGPETPEGSRTWMSEDGEVFVLGQPSDDGRAELGQWALSERGLFTVPIGEVCDLTDEPDSGTRC